MGRRGEPGWRTCWPAISGRLTQMQDILRFLYLLRAELRRFGNACASLSMPSHLCTGDGWVQKLGWLSDACVTLAAFSGKHFPCRSVSRRFTVYAYRQSITVRSISVASRHGRDPSHAGAAYASVAQRPILDAAWADGDGRDGGGERGE